MKYPVLLCVLAATSLSDALAQDGLATDIPEDLLNDAHFLEEVGVNKFTTPSIRKIFEDLEKLNPLPYEKLRREIPERVPRDRTQVALGLGGMIADGFLTVQAEQPLDLVDVGRAMTKRAKMLGAGMRLSENTKSLIDSSVLRDWDKLKEDLSKTQKDVEKEMVLLRDVDAAHLISLGGWLRAFEIGCVTSLEPFDPEKSRVLGKKEFVDYFLGSLNTLEPRMQQLEHIQELKDGLAELSELLDVPEGKAFSQQELEVMRNTAGNLVAIAEGREEKLQPVASNRASKKNSGEETAKDSPGSSGKIETGEAPDQEDAMPSSKPEE